MIEGKMKMKMKRKRFTRRHRGTEVLGKGGHAGGV
jgi:hypothetical protein